MLNNGLDTIARYDFRKATEIFEILYKKNKDMETLTHFIFALHMNGENEKALHYIKILESKIDLGFDALLNKAEIFYMLGRYSDSISTFYEAFDKMSGQCPGYFFINLGYSLMMNHEYSKALKNLSMARSMLKQNTTFETAVIQTGLGCCRTMLGEIRVAKNDIGKSVSLLKEGLVKLQSGVEIKAFSFMLGEAYCSLSSASYFLGEEYKDFLHEAIKYFRVGRKSYCGSSYMGSLYIGLCNLILEPNVSRIKNLRKNLQFPLNQKRRISNYLSEICEHYGNQSKRQVSLKPFPAPLLPSFIALAFSLKDDV